MYQCVAGNKHGEVYSNAELRVIGKTPPQFTECAGMRTPTLACAHPCLRCVRKSVCFQVCSLFRWPLASLLLATNWKALIIRWMRPADSDVCSELLCSPASPICAVKPVTLRSLLAAALIHHSTSGASHPDRVADWARAQYTWFYWSMGRKKEDVGEVIGQHTIFLKRVLAQASCYESDQTAHASLLSISSTHQLWALLFSVLITNYSHYKDL